MRKLTEKLCDLLKLKQEEVVVENRSFWIQALHLLLLFPSGFLLLGSTPLHFQLYPPPSSPPRKNYLVSRKCFLTSSYYKTATSISHPTNSLSTTQWVGPKCVTNKIIQLSACYTYISNKKGRKYWYCRLKDRCEEKNFKSCEKKRTLSNTKNWTEKENKTILKPKVEELGKQPTVAELCLHLGVSKSKSIYKCHRVF